MSSRTARRPFPAYYAPVTFNIVNPVGGGVTLLSIGSLNMSQIVQNSTQGGYGYGNLILTGNGNFSVTTLFNGGSA